jgi:CMP-N,N'-diacetyllegionaminic acid synthase
MIENKKVLAIIPARGGSKGLPGKNIMPMCGKPLIGWSISQAAESKYIDEILVTSDNQNIIDVARKFGAIAPFVRPKSLANDDASSVDVLLHAVDFLAEKGDVYDYLVLLEPTSPLRSVSDIDGALELLFFNQLAESVVGVAKAEGTHPSFLFSMQDEFLRPMLSSQPTGLRRQDLNGVYYYLEGSIYITTITALIRQRSFYHSKTMPWVVDRYKAIEIDEIADFIVAEALMKAKIEGVLK